ncbi:MAG: FAD-dependent oxidoreductase, partial [Chloroflexi bacterium]|nr:FAD-dependent oxidoreductase [Chloroflexota bacterium]
MAEQPAVELPAERVPVLARCDLLVVGGGAAGLSAAIAARRQGADVILVERYGYLGGLASGGLIVLLLTLDDGAGRQVVAGLCQELVERLEARDACFYPPSAEWGDPSDELVERYRRWGLVWGSAPHKVRYSVAYDPEEFKLVANNWVAEAGVRLLYHRWASDLVRDGDRVTHVVFTSKAGRQAIACDAVVDTTGDGDLFALAGEPFELEQVHPWLWFRMSGIEDVEALQEAGGDGFFRTVRAGQALMPWGP